MTVMTRDGNKKKEDSVFICFFFLSQEGTVDAYQIDLI